MFEKDQGSDKKEINCEEISEKLQLNIKTFIVLLEKQCPKSFDNYMYLL